MPRCLKGIPVLLSLLVLPTSAYAQATASIVGTARDASGAVLPGVVVEASSPALIEKTRSVTTNGAGQYSIENLRPGQYTVTFTLAGFSVVRRDGSRWRAIARETSSLVIRSIRGTNCSK